MVNVELGVVMAIAIRVQIGFSLTAKNGVFRPYIGELRPEHTHGRSTTTNLHDNSAQHTIYMAHTSALLGGYYPPDLLFSRILITHAKCFLQTWIAVRHLLRIGHS